MDHASLYRLTIGTDWRWGLTPPRERFVRDALAEAEAPTFEGGVLEQESLSLIARYDEKLLAFLMRSA